MAKKDRDGERDEEKKYKGGEKKRKHHDQPEEGQHANSASKRSKTEKSGGKGKKDKKQAVEVVDDPDLARAKAAARPPPSYAEEDAQAPEEGQKGSRSNVSLVPKSTAEYLKEVVRHLSTLTDDEDRQLLVNNVLEEIRGKELQVAGDPKCSRDIETLLAHGSAAHLISYLSACLESGDLSQLAVSPFGSHVADKIFIRLSALYNSMSQEEADSLAHVLKPIAEEVGNHLFNFASDKFATHVARRVLCMLCGSDVLPGGAKGPQAEKAAGGEGEEGAAGAPPSSHKASKGSAPSGLAAKVSTDKAQAAGYMQPCRFPDLLEPIVRVLSREDYVGPQMSDLVYGRYSSPFLQTALRAATTLPNSKSVLSSVIPAVLGATFFVDNAKAGKLLEGVPADKVQEMAQDQTGSRVLEVVIAIAPSVPGLLDELINRYFKGKTKALAEHPSANFVLQAVLAAATTPAQVQALHEELSTSIKDLIQRRRSGVVAALVAACGRAGVCQKEVCSALAAALVSTGQWAGKTAEQAAAPALLCLDTYGVSLGQDVPLDLSSAEEQGGKGGGPRLSALGGTILINILKFAQGASRSFTDSLVGLGRHDLARVGRDPAGSRALEALLEGTAPLKVKQKLLASLVGSYGLVAATGPGSFLVEKAYSWAEGDTKASVVQDLIAAERVLSNKHWGPRLLSRVGAEAYKRDPQQWSRQAAASSRTMAEFASIFGDEGGSNKKSKGRNKEHPVSTKPKEQEHNTGDDDHHDGGDGTEQAAAGVEQGQQEEVEGAGRKQKKKGKKSKEQRQGGEAEEQAGEQPQQGQRGEEGGHQDEQMQEEAKPKLSKEERKALKRAQAHAEQVEQAGGDEQGSGGQGSEKRSGKKQKKSKG